MNSERVKDILKDSLYNGLTDEYYKEILNYICQLENISNSRIETILEIENYCNDEKEDLISGCEVCEDILNKIEKLKNTFFVKPIFTTRKLEQTQKEMEILRSEYIGEKLKNDRVIEELKLWQPEIEALKMEKNYLLDILEGKDDGTN